MKIHDFPHRYEAERKRIAQQQIDEELAHSNDRQTSIRNQVTGSRFYASDIVENVVGFGSIGFFVGFFVCCMSIDSDNMDMSLMNWIALTILGVILGIVWTIFSAVMSKNNEKNAENESAKERFRRDNAVQQINEQAERDIAAYTAEFEAEAQRMSVNYAESTLATEVIEWMTAGFSAAITAADRSEHIEKIVVPFSFKVFNNKICCDRGTYDFKVKRCANLTSPLQQTALSRAIASAIHLNIIMEYPKDSTGTEYVITTSHEYYSDYANVNITYTAPNGNYRPVQNW